MKKLILAALLVASSVASAEEVMHMDNAAGGSLVLTSRPCVLGGQSHPDYRSAFVTTSSGLSMAACWTPVNARIAVVFADGDLRFYQPSDFRVTKLRK